MQILARKAEFIHNSAQVIKCDLRCHSSCFFSLEIDEEQISKTKQCLLLWGD